MSRLSKIPFDGFLAALVGTVALAAMVPARGPAAALVDHAVFAAVALLFFLYGIKLSPAAVLSGLAHWRLQGFVLATTFVVFPLMGLAVAALVHSILSPPLVLGLIYVCVLPSTVQSSIAFTAIARGNTSAALCCASVSNLLGIVVTPLLVTAILRTHGAGLGLGAARDIALQLLVPFVAGQVCRPLTWRWLARHSTLTGLVDRGSILVIVYAAFGEGIVAGIWSHLTPITLAAIIMLDSLILAIVLVFTTLTARRFGFSREDEIAIVFCGSKKSMAGGIPMANILFPGQQAALILLPLMIFHQIQLFVCATLAKRYALRCPDAERLAGTRRDEGDDSTASDRPCLLHEHRMATSAAPSPFP